mgnify:CR=1 FL=1
MQWPLSPHCSRTGSSRCFRFAAAQRDSIITGNQNVATRVAAEIRRYISTNAELLKALGADLQETGLQSWQQDRILKNYVLQFREFKEITLFDEAGEALASSRVGAARVPIPKSAAMTVDGVAMSPIRVDDDLLPTTVFGIHLKRLNQPSGWLAGEFSLEEMWRMVDRIRIGQHGFAMVVAPDGELVAHGDPDKKALVALSRNMSKHPLVSALQAVEGDMPIAAEYGDEDGDQKLGVAARVVPLDWTVIVEQPTSEAYADANRLRRQLVVAILLALLVMVSIGYVFGRSFISPILTLQRATQTVAAGQLDARVDIRTGDEFTDLGGAFNTMADRLVELTENIKRQERQAMFGRIAAGLVHDLSHPIQNLGNSSRLLVREELDAESRRSILTTIERELETLKRFMDDLRNVVKPRPVERFALDINASVAEVVDPMRSEGERVKVALEAFYATEPLRHRRGSLCPRTCVSESDHECHSGHAARRPSDRPDGSRWRPRRDQCDGHRFWHCARPLGADLRGFRHDQATRSRPRFGHLEAHRRGSSMERSPSRASWGEVQRLHYGFGPATIVRFRPQQVERAREGAPAAMRGPKPSEAEEASISVSSRRGWGPAASEEGSIHVSNTIEDRSLSHQRPDGSDPVFRAADAPGARRYSVEILLGPDDRIILDDDSVNNLEARTACLVPATLYSRLLAGRATAA